MITHTWGKAGKQKCSSKVIERNRKEFGNRGLATTSRRGVLPAENRHISSDDSPPHTPTASSSLNKASGKSLADEVGNA